MLRPEQSLAIATLSDADYVHDVAFDYYGARLAVCTSSLKIIIFGREADDNAWEETAVITMPRGKGHMGPIWRLSWGGPEYGEPLASCSEDCTVMIWTDRAGRPSGRASSSGVGWVHCETLTCDKAVLGVRFAPSAFGLKVAACTAERVRVFECAGSSPDGHWGPGDIVESPKGVASAAVSGAAIDWMHPPFGAGAAADDHECLAVASAGQLSIYSKRANHWTELDARAHETLREVKDVAWCPNLCRPYELVATCGTGAALWRVTMDSLDRGNRRDVATGLQLSLLTQLVPESVEGSLIWRCSWNLTGTSLALCPEGGEGFVSVWKASGLADEWQQECDVETDVGH